MTASRCAAWPTSRVSYGDGDIRLTVWQNLLISGVARDAHRAGREHACGDRAHAKATSVRAGLVACTGNTGCKFAAPTPRTRRWRSPIGCDASASRSTLPINIHLTGCPHSCAQHYIGDIGLHRRAACRCAGSEDTVEGFHVLVGGGFGTDAGIAPRALPRRPEARTARRVIERILRAYLASPRRRDGNVPDLHPPPRRRRAEGHGRGDAGDAQHDHPATDRARASSSSSPETAPFSTEQRAWLNGFFAGLLSLDAQAAAGWRAAGCCRPRRFAARRRRRRPWHDAAMRDRRSA